MSKNTFCMSLCTDTYIHRIHDDPQMHQRFSAELASDERPGCRIWFHRSRLTLTAMESTGDMQTEWFHWLDDRKAWREDLMRRPGNDCLGCVRSHLGRPILRNTQ
jgi:hypothetical protein